MLNKIPKIGLGTSNSPVSLNSHNVYNALSLGYRMIDTALIYGNQVDIGIGIKKFLGDNPDIKRYDLFVISKLWCTSHDPDYVEEECKLSIKQLGIDYIDLYLIHWPISFIHENFKNKSSFPLGNDFDYNIEPFPRNEENGDILIDKKTNLIDTWNSMQLLVKKGIVKNIGVSNFSKEQIDYIISETNYKPAVNQIEIHPYFNNKDLITHNIKNGIIVMGHSIFGSFRGKNTKDNIPIHDDTIKFLSKYYNKSPQQIIIQWNVQNNIIVIPRSSNRKRMEENFNINTFRISNKHMEDINNLNRNLRQCNPIWLPNKKKIYEE